MPTHICFWLIAFIFMSSCSSSLDSDQRHLNRHLDGAEAGDADDQYIVGALYWQGHAKLQNHKEAAKWLIKSAEQGDADAQLAVGCLYISGEGVKEDHAAAVKWLTKAAKQNNTDAQHILGLCYQKGDGVKPDKDKAIEWLTKSYALGCKEAGKDLFDLFKQ